MRGFDWIFGSLIAAVMWLPGGKDLQTDLSNWRIIAEEGVLSLTKEKFKAVI